MRDLIILELTKLSVYYNNSNLNSQTIPPLADMWLEDFDGEIYTPEFFVKAVAMARKKTDFLPKPRLILECYREIVAESQRNKAVALIEACSSERYEPTPEEWQDLRNKIKHGFKSMEAPNGNSKDVSQHDRA